MRALITGASGFAGRHLNNYLVQLGFEVMGTSRSYCSINLIENLDFKCDVTNYEQVKKVCLFFKPDYIFHLAGPAFIPSSYSNPNEAHNTIYNGTKNILDIIKDYMPNTKLLYVSSADVYGSSIDICLDEKKNHPNPMNPYSLSKACAELMCIQYYNSYGIDTKIVRPFNHTGPGQSRDFVCSDFAYQIVKVKKGHSYTIHVGNIDVERDFTDVRDIVRGYVDIVQNGQPREIYNLCSGKPISLKKILQLLSDIADITNYKIMIESNKVRKNDIKIRYGSNEKIKKLANWDTEIDIKTTLIDLYTYWEDNYESYR